MGFANFKLSSTVGQCGCCPSGQIGQLIVKIAACLAADNAPAHKIAGTLRLQGPNGEDTSVGPSLTTSLGGDAVVIADASVGTWTISLTATKFYSRTITATVVANTTTTATVATQGTEIIIGIQPDLDTCYAIDSQCYGSSYSYQVTGPGFTLSGEISTAYQQNYVSLRQPVADNLSSPISVTVSVDPPEFGSIFLPASSTTTWNCDPVQASDGQVMAALFLRPPLAWRNTHTCIQFLYFPTTAHYSDDLGECDLSFDWLHGYLVGNYTCLLPIYGGYGQPTTWEEKTITIYFSARNDGCTAPPPFAFTGSVSRIPSDCFTFPVTPDGNTACQCNAWDSSAAGVVSAAAEFSISGTYTYPDDCDLAGLPTSWTVTGS